MVWPSVETRLSIAEDALKEISERVIVMETTSTISQSLADQMSSVRRIAETALMFKNRVT